MRDRYSYNLVLLGGTGAKCGEIIIHMCANGYLDCKELNILYIDSDTTNGNAQYFKRVVKLYQACRKQYLIKESPIPSFFKPEIRLICENPVKGVTYFKDLAHQSSKSTIEKDSAEVLMKALYTDEERNMKISEGFFARPNVGAALFAANMDRVMGKFLQFISSDQKDMKEIRIFMLGSIFGGTGASSLPTISKYLKQKLFGDSDNKLIHEEMKIGGCMVLPYFSFSRKNLSEEILSGEKIPIEADKFVTKTKSALKYYKYVDEDQGRQVFDSLYILGHDRYDVRGMYETAGSNQRNLPHITEFYSAMSAVDFFESKIEERGHYFAAVPVEVINWRNIHKYPKGFYHFVLMMRFAIVMKSLILEELFDYTKDNKLKEKAKNIPWYYDFLDGKKSSTDMDEMRLYEKFNNISCYCSEYIRWFAELNISNIEMIENLDQIEYTAPEGEESDVMDYLHFFSKEILIQQFLNDRIVDGKEAKRSEEELSNLYHENLNYIRKHFCSLEEKNFYTDEKTENVTLDKIWSRICALGFNNTIFDDKLIRNISKVKDRNMNECVKNLINAIYISCMF